MAQKEKSQAEAVSGLPQGYQSRLIQDYRGRIVPEMQKQFGYNNIMQVPKLEKIVLNMGVGEGSRDVKLLESLQKDMATVTGQKPVLTKAKKSISQFKVREGMPVGISVTLRRNRMYDFVDRFVNVCIPRIRDFRGLSPRSFDGRGNYSMGVREQLIFPEIHYDHIPKIQGMDVIIVTSAQTDEEGLALLKLFGMPFRN